MFLWGILITAIGIILILSAILDWDWIIRIWKDAGWAETFGRKGALKINAMIGLIGVVIGILIMIVVI